MRIFICILLDTCGAQLLAGSVCLRPIRTIFATTCLPSNIPARPRFS